MAELRSEVSEIAERHGLSILASGTHPSARWSEQMLCDDDRYIEVAQAVQMPSARAHADSTCMLAFQASAVLRS